MRKYLAEATRKCLALLFFAGLILGVSQTVVRAEALSDAQLRALFIALGFEDYDINYDALLPDKANGGASFSKLILVPAKHTALSTSYKIDSAVVTGLNLKSNSVAFQTLSIENLTITSSQPSSGSSPIKIQSVEIAGADLPALNKLALDPKKQVTSQINFLKALTSAKLGRVKAVGIRWGTNVSIRQGVLTNFSAGKIHSLEIDGYASSAPDGAPKEAIEKILIELVDLDPFIRLFDESAYLEAGAARPWRNLFEAMKISGFKLGDSPSLLSFKSAVIGPVRLRRFTQSLTERMDEAANDPNPESGATLDTARRVQSAARDAIMINKVDLEGFAYELPNTAGTFISSIASVTLSAFTFEHIDAIEMKNVSVSDSSGAVSLGRLLLGDIQLEGVFDGDLADQVSSGLSVPVDVIEWPKIGRVYFDTFSADFKDAGFKVGRFDLYMRFFVGPIPTSISVGIDNLLLDKKTIRVTALQDALTALGYEHIDLSGKVSVAWQDSLSSLAFDTISITGKDMGTLALSGNITGISRKSFIDPDVSFPAELSTAGLQSFRISFANASLYDRTMTFLARQNGISVDEIKKVLSANVPEIMSGISNAAIRNKFIFAAVSFINDPNILELSNSTGDVVPLADIARALSDPLRLPELLKLDASANDRKRD